MMTKYIFEETQIGSHITTNFICIDRTDSVKEAMNQLLVQARNQSVSYKHLKLPTTNRVYISVVAVSLKKKIF